MALYDLVNALLCGNDGNGWLNLYFLAVVWIDLSESIKLVRTFFDFRRLVKLKDFGSASLLTFFFIQELLDYNKFHWPLIGKFSLKKHDKK